MRFETFFLKAKEWGLSFEAVFCCGIRVSCLAGQVSIVAAKYGSIVIAVSVVTANCLLKVNCSSQLQMCARYSVLFNFPLVEPRGNLGLAKTFEINLVLIMRTE